MSRFPFVPLLRIAGALPLLIVSGNAVAAAQAPGASGASEVEVFERVVALVNGEMITLGELERQVAVQAERVGLPDDPELAATFRTQLLQGMVDNVLVLQIADQRGLRVPDRYFEEWRTGVMEEMGIADEDEFIRQVELQGTSLAEIRRNFEQGVLLQEIQRQEVSEKVTVSEPEIEQRYRENIDDFMQPPRVRLREFVAHVSDGDVAAAEAKVAEARALLDGGEDFAAVAEVRSDSESAESGGDLGLFAIGELNETFRDVVEATEVGGVAGPVRIGDSLYLLKVEERTEETTTPLDEVRAQIADAVYAEKMEAAMAGFVRRLRENAIIEIRLDDPATNPEAEKPGPAR